MTILRGLCITRLLNFNGDVIAAYNLTDIPAEGLGLDDAASLEGFSTQPPSRCALCGA
ncbi:MAG: hypothetical protein IPI35_35475 [Deltaproteobacteria bacterium]|nr:hypothetical protein [Deltaproteobacteria bacterium]